MDNIKEMKEIENFIKDNNGEYTHMEIWRNMPINNIKFDVFNKIFDEFRHSNKIMKSDNDGKIIWIFNPELKKELLKKSVKI